MTKSPTELEQQLAEIKAALNDYSEGELPAIMILERIEEALEDAKSEKVKEWERCGVQHQAAFKRDAERITELRDQLAAEREVGHNQAVTLGQQIARLEDQLAAEREKAKSYAAALDEIATTGADTLDGYEAANIATAALARFNAGEKSHEQG